VDDSLGLLFDHLEKQKLLSRTIIILTSDHGEALGEKGEDTHSYFAYNNTVHVPLMIYAPGGSPRRTDANVSHIDIFPTVCDLLNMGIPKHLQGRSLVPPDRNWNDKFGWSIAKHKNTIVVGAFRDDSDMVQLIFLN
jgi:arylsulfatase A-like enzyme